MATAAQKSAGTEWRENWTLVLAAGAGVSLSAISSASLGVMMEPIERDFGWTRTQISLGISLVSLIGMSLATGAGLAIDRFGARRIGILVAILMCTAIGLMSTVTGSLWHWWAAWALVGVSAAAMPTVWITPVSAVFNSGRGLAVAITLCGSGISTSLVPIIANRLLEVYGWRGAYLGIAVIWGIIVLPLALLFLRNAHGPRRVVKASAKADVPPAELPGLTARQGFTSPTFYKLVFAAFLSMLAGVALILNLVPVLRSTGLTPATAASIAAIIGVATITGRIVGGWLMDRMNAAVIACVSTAGMVVLPLTLLIWPGSVGAAAAAVAIYGMLGGAKVPAVVYLASRHFGARAFGVLYGAVNTMIGLAVGLGPLMANYVYDITRSYVPVMWAAVPFICIGAALYLTLGKYPDFATPPARDAG